MALGDLPRATRKALERTFGADETIVGAWRGMRLPFGTDALVCTPTRAIIVKRAGFNMQANAFKYSDIRAVHVTWGSRLNPLKHYNTEMELAVAEGATRPAVSSLRLRDHAARIEAPNIINFGSGPSQEACVREALTLLEEAARVANG